MTSRKGDAGSGEPRYYGSQEKSMPGEMHYHSRSEAPHPEERKRGLKKRSGIFRNNPSLLLILIDIIVVVLVLVFLLPFLRPDSSNDDFQGYSFSMHGYLYRQTAHVSVIIQRAGPTEEAGSAGSGAPDANTVGPGEAGTAGNDFVIQIRALNTGTEETHYFRPGLETAETAVVRSVFDIGNEIDEDGITIRCEIFRNGESITLEKKLKE
jgi:hypothetical protein